MNSGDNIASEARWLTEVILSVLLPIFLSFAVLKLWPLFVRRAEDPRYRLPLPPGSFGLPIIGETLHLAAQGYDFFRMKRAKYGRIYVTHLMGRPLIRLYGSSNINRVLSSADDCLTMHWPRSVQLLMGEGALGQSKGRVHEKRRMQILSALSPQRIQTYLPIVQKAARSHVCRWQQEGSIRCRDDSRRLVLDATARALLGVEFDDGQLTSLLGALSTVQENFFSLPCNFPGFGFRKGMAARKFIMKQLDEAVHQAMSRCGDSDDQQDALSVLLSSCATKPQKLTLQEVKDSCLEMLFGSLEGISSALCTIMVKLAADKSCFEKAADEVRQWSSAVHDEWNAFEAPACVKNIVKEALRITPPVGGGYRKVLRTFELGGYQIPQGWTVLYSIRDQHECDDTIEDVDAFRPDRWNSGGAPDGSAYIPFGGTGSRSCIGQHFAVATLQAVACVLLSSCGGWRLSGAGSPRFCYFPTPYPDAGTTLLLSTK